MGSVIAYETKAGKRLYRIVYRRPDHKQTSERGFTRRRDAELRLAEVELGKAKGDHVNPADAREDVASIATGWLRAREAVMKPSSYQALKGAWETHVNPTWGARQVGGVRHSEVQDWVSELAQAKSATIVLRAYGVLAAVLDVAVKDRRVSRDVARGVALPARCRSRSPTSRTNRCRRSRRSPHTLSSCSSSRTRASGGARRQGCVCGTSTRCAAG